MLSQKRILICPLDWGLGHATRCIPIIRLLVKKNAKVMIAADGRPLGLLKQEFPDLEFIQLKGYDINYPISGSMMLKMVFSIPKIIYGIYNEHRSIKKIIATKNIDIVISDNRFGLWNKGVKSIFITHQLMIKTPVAEKLLYRINMHFIKKYDECWVPDMEGDTNLSGDLAHKYALPDRTFFIGNLSRFDFRSTVSDQKIDFEHSVITKKYDVLAIISGPEPQRSIFENLIINQFQEIKLKTLVVCGITEIEQSTKTINNMEIMSHLRADKMRQVILQSEIIISRSGYSTIMDLAMLGKKAIFIPTPGQTEQEYLAEMLMQKKIAYTQTQLMFDLKSALEEVKDYRGFEITKPIDWLEKRIDQL